MDILQAEFLYVQKMRSKNWSEKTIKNYASQIRLFLREFKQVDRARNITANNIEKYLLTKVNINSRKHVRCSINAFYKYVIGQNEKLKSVPSPKKESRLIEYVTSDEVREILKVCCNLKHKAIIMLLYGCGLRIGEVINLKPTDIRSKEGVINIIQGKGRKDRQVTLLR